MGRLHRLKFYSCLDEVILKRSVEEAIDDQIPPPNLDKETFFKYIKEVLILLDGLDEAKDSCREEIFLSLVLSKIFADCFMHCQYVTLTSRHEVGN